MPDSLTPRQLAKAQNIERIKELALRQLATEGASSLSLRAIARELNLVSSAIYRYYASRDELITALILDAYDDLADTLETAADTRRGPRGRWVDTCLALRGWAVATPHRFALIYGSAIPGYAAPADTIEPAARVVRALAAPVVAGGAPHVRRSLARPLAEQLRGAAEALELELEPSAVLSVVEAFAHLIGALTLELNGHFVGAFEPADVLFAALVEDMANPLGL